MKLSRTSRRGLPGLVTACVALGVSASDGSLYEWRFAVSLDGKPIGEHRFVLQQRDGLRELTSEAKFRVRFLFINAYHYEHSARELWRGDCLERLVARTDDNGNETVVSGEHDGGGFRVTTDGNVAGVEPCVQTFAYWNPSILDATRLLNPQTGEYLPVQVLDLGRATIGNREDAQHYRLLGDAGGKPLHIDLWYSPAHEWLALESLTPDGRRLRYSRE
jgi:hypothetical protein